MLWFSPPSSTVVRRGHCIVDTSRSYGLSTCEFFSSILGINWQDRITNLEALDSANSTSIKSMRIKAQLRWVGHVIRMEQFLMPRRLMYGELQLSKRNQGRPKLRYKDTVKANLQWCHIKPKELEERAMDRPKWRASTRKGCCQLRGSSTPETH